MKINVNGPEYHRFGKSRCCERCHELKPLQEFRSSATSRKYNHKWCRKCIEVKREEDMKKAEYTNNTRICDECNNRKPWNQFALCDKETGTRRKKCKDCKNKWRRERRRLAASGAVGSLKARVRYRDPVDEARSAARASEQKNPPQDVKRHCDGECGQERWMGDFPFDNGYRLTTCKYCKNKYKQIVVNLSMEDPQLRHDQSQQQLHQHPAIRQIAMIIRWNVMTH